MKNRMCVITTSLFPQRQVTNCRQINKMVEERIMNQSIYSTLLPLKSEISEIPQMMLMLSKDCQIKESQCEIKNFAVCRFQEKNKNDI